MLLSYRIYGLSAIVIAEYTVSVYLDVDIFRISAIEIYVFATFTVLTRSLRQNNDVKRIPYTSAIAEIYDL